MKIALTIAGSDSSGGAGVQGDVRTFGVLGVFGASAITAITAQNTTGVQGSLDIPADLVRKQIDSVAGDFEIHATKSGMLANRMIVEAVEDCLKRNKLQPYVCDPVMVAKSGAKLLADDAVDAMKKRLFPLATLITPNLREAATLLGRAGAAAETVAAGKDVARRLMQFGPHAVVVKGFMVAGDAVNLYYDGKEFLEFAGKAQDARKTHGSGCAFSAAITAGLAARMPLVEAIDQAKNLVNYSIQYSDGEGRGISPVNVLAFAPKQKKK